MSDNTLTITGNLPDDPELRFTQSGIAVATFTVMQTKREKQGDQFVDGAKNGLRVTVWRDMAENVAESLVKGSRVTVTGRLEPQNWQDRETGANRYGWELVADDVAASLRFHTAQPNKVDRRNGGRPAAPSPQGEQWNGGGQAAPAADPWAGGGNQGGYDDPPF